MIQDFNQEGKISLLCMITRADIGRTAKQIPYLSLTLEDKSGALDAKFWNLSEEQANYWKPGMIVEASGDLIRYRGAWQLKVFKMEEKEGTASDFIRSAPLTSAQMEEEVFSRIDQMNNPVIQDVCREVVTMKKDGFFEYPAAVRNHHNFPGGLAWHSLSMARLADAVVEQYPWLDKDLIIAGILLHDIGKTEEYTQPVLPEYSPAGNLIGHISMAAAMIDRVALILEVEDSEEVMLLKHMVLSHHGKLEYGSPVVPMTAEAEVLSALDNLDSRMYMIHEMLEAAMPAHFGPRNFALDNRMFYRKSWDNENGRPAAKAPAASNKEESAEDTKD